MQSQCHKPKLNCKIFVKFENYIKSFNKENIKDIFFEFNFMRSPLFHSSHIMIYFSLKLKTTNKKVTK